METLYDIGTGDLKELWDSDLEPLKKSKTNNEEEIGDLSWALDASIDDFKEELTKVTEIIKAMQEALKLSSDADMHDWFLERDVKMPQVILNDKLMTDALLGTLPIKTEHSYSLNSDGDSIPDSPISLQNKMEEMDDDCYPTMTNMHTLTTTTTATTAATIATRKLHQNYTTKSIQNTSLCNSTNNDTSSISSSDIDVDDSNVKDEPLSPGSSCPPSPTSTNYGINVNLANMAAYTNTDLVFEHKNGSLQLSSASQSLLKNQHILLNSTQPITQIQQQQPHQQQPQQQTTAQQRLSMMPKLNIKMEPQISTFGLPPTPPSSLSSEDSEGNQSPEHNISPMSPSAPITTSRRSSTLQNSPNSLSRGYTSTSSRQPIHTPLISSQPKGSTGSLLLTEEEKRTLIAEGYPIPTRLPLTKAEEKSLKKIRRKIKNKISAQESRRKKKEYMDQLERKVEILVSENTDYRKRVDTLEDSNANLLSQLTKLQALISRQTMKK